MDGSIIYFESQKVLDGQQVYVLSGFNLAYHVYILFLFNAIKEPLVRG